MAQDALRQAAEAKNRDLPESLYDKVKADPSELRG
jgi:hypothetical protein